MEELGIPEGYITSVEAAEILGTRRGYVYYLSDRGALSFKKVGFTRFYNREEVQHYKDTHPNLGRNRQTPVE